MANDILMELQTGKIIELMKQGKRIDGRALDEYRKLEIFHNISQNAEGSARVKLGETEVVAGVKMVPGDPFPETPAEGSISVGAEFLPLSSPTFESGPPGPEETELARVVDRGIRESKCLNFEDLCIKEKEKVWIAFIDLYTINFDGNLFDACSIAAMSALMQAKIPKLDKEYHIVKGEYSGKLELHRKPLLTTFSKIAGQIVVDTNFAEEKATEARFSVATTEDNYMAAFQKGLPGSFSGKELDDCIELAFKKAKDIRKHL